MEKYKWKKSLIFNDRDSNYKYNNNYISSQKRIIIIFINLYFYYMKKELYIIV